ncbi:M50 family metalloprotease [Natronomonas pharaonis DSM 2160]|uniref:Zinc metalloprotease n=1 Tax=Natronomonas pharaonis (strain ATCC 35678 / DSM 2160 / CIP 103997 / JCM 8858 / NBRC 14720 / NCIMB 2260 / Gabara) TaxID=348780 RepID=A0A1U7ETA2_NATPD|nr:CBS domain-containing protein [Natronomonas pharaonis]CAI48106.1 M50 family metalloprotease [Natronomonas pharaonis DSM 2160]
MFKSFRVGSIADIPIKLDITLLLILPVLAFLIGSGMGEAVEAFEQIGAAFESPELLVAGWTPWLLGFVAAVGLFVCVLLHELGHAAVARHYDYGIASITLWLLGGVARPEKQPEQWNHEFWIAIGGPVVSVALGIGCYLVYGFAGAEPVQSVLGVLTADSLRFLFGYLALLNIVLAAFNMLPAFPLDGGRVMRALLGRTRPFTEATKTAVAVGKFFAILFGIFGLLMFNPFLVAIAFFVYIAAAAEGRQTVLEAAFRGVRVADVMTPANEVRTVETTATLDAILDRMFEERHTGYPVVEGGKLVGIVTLADIRNVHPEKRSETRVADVMSEDLEAVSPDTEAMDAMRQLAQHSVGRLVVTDEFGNLAGLLTRSDLVTAMNVVQEKRLSRGEEAAPR